MRVFVKEKIMETPTNEYELGENVVIKTFSTHVMDGDKDGLDIWVAVILDAGVFVCIEAHQEEWVAIGLAVVGLEEDEKGEGGGDG
jgi:hypothetical protein